MGSVSARGCSSAVAQPCCPRAGAQQRQGRLRASPPALGRGAVSSSHSRTLTPVHHLLGADKRSHACAQSLQLGSPRPPWASPHVPRTSPSWEVQARGCR